MAKAKKEKEVIEEIKEEFSSGYTFPSFEELINSAKEKIDLILKKKPLDRGALLKAVSTWSDLVIEPEFTEEMFLFYQNYIGYNPEILLDFLKTHAVTEEFLERFFNAKKWGIHPAYILKYQSHLTGFIKKYKEYFNPEDYDKIINPKKVDKARDKFESKIDEVKDNLEKIKSEMKDTKE